MSHESRNRLRASIMVHLPALTECGQIDNIAASFSNIGLTVRGIYGEGSQPSGCVYQISNSVSLGVSEKEIIKLLENALSQLEASEKKLAKACPAAGSRGQNVPPLRTS